MMDELLEGINENEHLKFIVSLDNNEINPMLYNCTEWGDLYSEYGDFGNDPMILNGDEDLDGDGYPDNHIWNTLSTATTYSAYAFIDHNMVVRYMFDTPNLYDFQYNYIPNLLDGIYGCTDENASNYDVSAGIDDGSCEYNITGDINLDGQINILDIVQLANMILSDDYQESADLNGDGNLNILDIVQLVNIILGVKSLRLLFFSILYIAIITAENDRCISSDIPSDNPSVVTSRGYDIGDTLSIEDQQRPYNVCHSDNNYLVGETFTFNDFNGYENGGDFNIIIISMNATW